MVKSTSPQYFEPFNTLDHINNTDMERIQIIGKGVRCLYWSISFGDWVQGCDTWTWQTLAQLRAWQNLVQDSENWQIKNNQNTGNCVKWHLQSIKSVKQWFIYSVTWLNMIIQDFVYWDLSQKLKCKLNSLESIRWYHVQTVQPHK